MSTEKTTAELSHPFILALMAILVASGAALLGYSVGHQQGMTVVGASVRDVSDLKESIAEQKSTIEILNRTLATMVQLMGAIGLLIAVNFAGNPAIAILGLSIATMGALTGLPMFWPMPTALLSAGAAVAGLAIINSVGQMAGFLSPYLVGFIKDQTGSTDAALYSLAALIVLGSLVALRVTRAGALSTASAS